MAQHTTITVNTETWTELTNANVTSITLQNKTTRLVNIAVTTGSAPSSSDEAFDIPPLGLLINENLSDLAPGIAGTRVWALGSGDVHVSHG